MVKQFIANIIHKFVCNFIKICDFSTMFFTIVFHTFHIHNLKKFKNDLNSLLCPPTRFAE